MINGIQITLKNEAGEIEKPVFATNRKHPKLLGLLKAIDAAETRESSAARAYFLARQELDQATAETIEKAEEKAIALSAAALEAGNSAINALRDFVVEGFKGAGYAEAEAERYAGMVLESPERFAELKSKCLLGSGRMDFFTTGSQAKPS